MTNLPVNPPCCAPDSALYFRPDGIVAACCASWHVLGRINGTPRDSLAEIWQGAQAETLRHAVATRDWGFGCWECGKHIDSGNRDQSLAADFDDVAQKPGSRYPRLMDFALSNRCNLQCVMCNGGLSSTIRQRREHRPPLPPAYDDRFFDELQEFLPHLHRASFKGGEPFLAPESQRIWDLMLRDGTDCEVAVTTNGTVLTNRTARYIRELRMAVNVSVDAVDPELLKSIRVGVDPFQLWRNIDEFREMTAEVGSTLTMSFCLMSTNWRELPRFLSEVRRRDAAPNIIWVDGPEHHSIFALPPGDLQRAADELRIRAEHPAMALDEDDRTTLTRAADRIEAGAVPNHALVAVKILPIRQQSAVPDEDPVDPAERTADSVLRLTFHNGIVRRAESPDWAGWLQPDEWIGVGLEELMNTVAARAGGSMRGTMSVLPSGAHRAMIDFPDRPDRPALEAVYVPAGHGTSTVTLHQRPRSDGSR